MVKQKEKTLEELLKLCDKHIDALHRVHLFTKEGTKRISAGIVWRISSSTIKAVDHLDENGKQRFEGRTALKAMEGLFNYLKENELI